MENDSFQHRSTVPPTTMGVNSQPIFGAQGDQTNEKLTLLPVLQNPLDSSTTHPEQFNKKLLSNTKMNWEMESNYLCSSVHLNDCVSQSTKSNTDEEIQHDGLNHSNQPQSTNKPNFTNFSNTDLNGSKVIRLVRAKQATKRKSSLDTLIEVVQKELLRVNGQSNSSSPSSSPPRSSNSSHQTSNRSIISTILPSSNSHSLTSQTNQSLRITRKRTNNPNTKRNHQRTKSFSDDDDQQHQSEENIEEIVRDTVDKLVAITLLNTAPFIVNMITGTDGKSSPTASNSLHSKPLTNHSSTSDFYRNDLALLSSTASELRNSMPQNSPNKSPSTNTDSPKPSTVFVTPRIVNFQTVVPKPTTNIQIGNTKIILVSPSNSSSASSPISPVKLVKLTPTLPKNVQIVIPSRTANESLSTIRPVPTCAIDQIPQAAQEVTITTSPNFNKPRRRSSSTTPTDKPVGKILRPIAKVLPVYSPTDEVHKPMTVNFSPRVPATHGPMIYRMTSVNPNVPVFRVRAPTTSTIKTDTKSTPTPGATAGTSVSVLACFKTTKKRAKERAIMPRPATTTADSLESSHDLQSPRLTSTNSTPLSMTNSNSNGHENSTAEEQITKKRHGQTTDESWTAAADTLLRNILSQYGFRFLDLNCQQNLSARFDIVQANLVSGMISSKDDFYKSVVEIKENLLESGLSKISADNLEKLFLYFENEYPKLAEGNFDARTNDRKRTRRQ